MDKAFEKRKKVVYDFICDSLYVPMKFKELAMILQVPKEQRDELREVLESLEADGKIYLSKRGKLQGGGQATGRDVPRKPEGVRVRRNGGWLWGRLYL